MCEYFCNSTRSQLNQQYEKISDWFEPNLNPDRWTSNEENRSSSQTGTRHCRWALAISHGSTWNRENQVWASDFAEARGNDLRPNGKLQARRSAAFKLLSRPADCSASRRLHSLTGLPDPIRSFKKAETVQGIFCRSKIWNKEVACSGHLHVTCRSISLANSPLSHEQYKGRSLNYALFYRLLIITDYWWLLIMSNLFFNFGQDQQSGNYLLLKL